MKTNILNYINKLQAYKTAIKNLHWSSKHMSEHKLLDEIADNVANNQDEIAEMCQGLYGKIKLNELKPKRYSITNSKKMLYDLLRDTKTFYSSIKGREIAGVRSVVETFIGDINKFIYLMDMCIKEDIKHNLIKTQINENHIININEKELRQTIKEAIDNVADAIKTTEFIKYSNKINQKIENMMHEINLKNHKTKQTIEAINNMLEHLLKIVDCKNIYVQENDYNTIICVEIPTPNNLNNDDSFIKYENYFNKELKQFDEIGNITIELSDNVNQNNMLNLYLIIESKMPIEYEF